MTMRALMRRLRARAPMLTGNRRRAGRAMTAAGVTCLAAVCLAHPASGAPVQGAPGEADVIAAPVAPARPGLEAVPLPSSATLEAAVGEQIGAAARAVAGAVSERDGELAARYGELGMLLHAYELFDGAEPAYRNARRLAPGDSRWPYLSGYLHQQTGRYAEAAAAFEHVRRADPGRREAAVRLGDVYVQMNRLREARAQYEEIRDVFPALARNGLGEVALREGRFDDAVDHFRAVLQRAPAATVVHYSLGMAYRGLGRGKEAREHLQRRGPGALTLGDPLVDQLQSLVRGERGLVMRGRRAFEAGLFDQAAAAFGEAVAAAPESADARMNLGLSLARLGRDREAAAELQRAVDLDPGSMDGRAALGLLLVDQQRDAEALVHLQLAFEPGSSDRGVRVGLVGALLRLGRVDEAITVLERARTADPDDEDTVVSLAILFSNRQRFRDAIAVLEESYRVHPDRAATVTTLTRLLSSSPDPALRDGRRALALAEAAYAEEPSSVHAESVALALAELQRCQEAAGWLRRAIRAARDAGEREETTRLEGQLPHYEAASCRR
jgi:tetratricopeptide (TPR) repeat protein